MAAHPARTWLIVTGVVLLVVQVALVVCWWKLPQWAPEWIIAHSPWPEPALRALRHSEVSHHQFRFHLSEFGPAIGPALLHLYGKGDTTDRLLMLVLATDLAVADGVRPDSGPPPRRFTSGEVAVLREELVEMARLAFIEGSLALGESASFLAARLRDRRLTPLMCGILHGQSTPIGPEVSNVVTALGVLGDPRAVPTLIPLLPIRHKPHPMVEEALAACLAEESLPHVIAATYHSHEVVRVWAAGCLERFPASRPLAERVVALTADHERQVALKAITMATRYAPQHAGATLRQVLATSSDEQVQQAARVALAAIAERVVPSALSEQVPTTTP